MCFSVSIVRFGWAGGPQRQFGSFRGWVCRLISFLQMENSLRSDSSICRNNAAAPIPKLLDLCCMSSHPSKSDSRSCWKQIFHIYLFAWCSVRRIYVMSSDAKDTKACYTKAGVRAAPIKYGAFLFLLFGGSSECSAQGNAEYLIGAVRPPFPKHSS